MNQPKQKECELVNGSWYDYFNKVVSPLFDDQIMARYDDLFSLLYGNFFERNLSQEKGKLLSLGAGFGMSEIPLARKGYKIIGIDNDVRVLELLAENSRKYANGNLEARFGDLYRDFDKEFINQGIQACISFGVLEHFKRKDLDEIIRKQFQISPLMICMMPIDTPATLKAFKAEQKPEGHIDDYGIFRNFWPVEFWEKEVLGKYCIIDKCFPTNHVSWGQVDMVTFAVRND